MTVTFAPEATAPLGSDTVPEILPVAWPRRNGHRKNASEQTIAANNALLVSILRPLKRQTVRVSNEDQNSLHSETLWLVNQYPRFGRFVSSVCTGLGTLGGCMISR